MRTQLFYTVEVRDRNGKLLTRESRKSRSYVKQYNQMIANLNSYTDIASVKDTGGIDRTLDSTASAYHLRVDSGAGVDDMSIVVGTGVAAVTISDFQLGSQIAHGTSTDQLDHQASSFSTPTVSGSECSFTITRAFLNGSGATITVKEIGIYYLHVSTATPRYFLGVRDVLATSQAVPNGGAITVVYTIKHVV